jgi:hypothetical protein
VTGHSRGAKLAALHFAGSQAGAVRAAFLIDPVDNTSFTPESEAYPSACRALARCGRPLGAAGCRSADCWLAGWLGGLRRLGRCRCVRGWLLLALRALARLLQRAARAAHCRAPPGR